MTTPTPTPQGDDEERDEVTNAAQPDGQHNGQPDELPPGESLPGKMPEPEPKVPDVAETKLAFRVWRLDTRHLTLLSLNMGKIVTPRGMQPNWAAKALSKPEGGWQRRALQAVCANSHREEHGPVPGKECTCGIYATTSLKVIRDYLSPDAPVMGVVELGGHVIPATQGFRAEYARVAAILLIDPVISLPRGLLEDIAEFYKVPALVPHSTEPDDYRDLLRLPESGSKGVGDEADEWLKSQGM